MNQVLKIRRGTQADLPYLGFWQFGFTTDTKRLYIGNGVGNILLASALSDRKSVFRTAINLTLNETHYAVFANTASGNITLTLPDATANQGQIYVIKKIHKNNKVTVIPSGTDVIEEDTEVVLNKMGESVTLIAENTNWWVI